MYFLIFSFAFESSSVIQNKLIFMLVMILLFDQIQHEVDILIKSMMWTIKLWYITWERGGKSIQEYIYLDGNMVVF